MRIAIVGTGAWGLTLAAVLGAHGREIRLWARTPAEAERLARERRDPPRLPRRDLPPAVEVTADLAFALAGADILLLVPPAQRVRENLQQARPALDRRTIVVVGSKGLELPSGQRLSQVLAEELPSTHGTPPVVLSGPNLAGEIAAGLPASSVVACVDRHVASVVQQALTLPTLRIYTNPDVIGVELGGSLKNIVAIAAGIADGLGVGNNGKAGIMTRGLAEMTRLGVAEGASALTFAGLSGLGDLVATCASPLSRNRRLGELLGKGYRLDDACAALEGVAEGVPTTPAALALARRHGVELPIAEHLYTVLFEGKSPPEAVADLMARPSKQEFEGLTAGN
ncbi:MAG: NAD(P)-dependent glycerol-3-phosphate dehydrogenase [Chloroflexi bacterium]|nr:NAD(P)-dependent glycerol-3-phosphate dehydrogenase [Chloroflexota bacterium]